MKRKLLASFALAAALLGAGCDGQYSQNQKPAEPTGINIKTEYRVPGWNVSLKEYTSEAAPGQLFTVVAGGTGVATTSAPIGPASSSTDPIHLKSEYRVPGWNVTVKEYTSDNAPGQLFTMVAGGTGVDIVATPIEGTPAASANPIHLTREFRLKGWNASVKEYTSDNAPGQLFTITAGGTGVSIKSTPLPR
ncbi:MAG: hypothetical protein ACAH80_02845 [Alphaproteobacteria bacterium]